MQRLHLRVSPQLRHAGAIRVFRLAGVLEHAVHHRHHAEEQARAQRFGHLAAVIFHGHFILLEGLVHLAEGLGLVDRFAGQLLARAL